MPDVSRLGLTRRPRLGTPDGDRDRDDDVAGHDAAAPAAGSGDPVRRGFVARDVALIAGFAALTAVLAVAPPILIPGNPVPLTLQNLGVMLAGAVLGWKRGAAAIALMLVVGMLGVPVLPGGRPVLAALAGTTAGYLIGWVVAAGVIGALVQLRLPHARAWWIGLACLLGGIGVVYAFGVPVVAARTQTPLPQVLVASIVFLPGDLLKAAVATTVAGAVHRAVPGLTPSLRRR